MGEQSKIEWCDHTFNPWIGCTKVSPGCVNCYAETEDKRRGWTPHGWGNGRPRKLTSKQNWHQPYVWNARCARLGITERVFCASLADVFDPEVPDEWRKALFDTITDCKNLDWLILTKRPEIALDFYDTAIGLKDETIINRFLPNVWIGVSVEDQKRSDERIPLLLQIPAKVRFLSCEPLLGPVDLVDPSWDNQASPDALGVNWVIIGGESGPNSRECNIEWIRSLIGQCKSAGVPVFVKQLGRNATRRQSQIQGHLILADRKGGDLAEWPTDLRIREFPKLEVAA